MTKVLACILDYLSASNLALSTTRSEKYRSVGERCQETLGYTMYTHTLFCLTKCWEKYSTEIIMNC